MLDAFNYPSPPFTRTGTPAITRAGTPAPRVVGKSGLGLNVVATDENGDDQDAKKGDKSGGDDDGNEDGGDNDDNDEDRIAGFGKKMKRKKVVEEPSAASILDNFDF